MTSNTEMSSKDSEELQDHDFEELQDSDESNDLKDSKHAEESKDSNELRDSNEEGGQLLERMTNSEFRQFLPYLDIEDILTTEISLHNKWLYLITKSQRADKSFGVYCHACSERLLTDEVLGHLRSEDHAKALMKVKQFYHPAFTYFRGAKRLMNGEKTSEKQLKEDIEFANIDLNRPISGVATQFAFLLRTTKCSNSKSSKVLENIVFNEPITDTQHMFAEVSLPLLTLLKLEYKKGEGEWEPMLTASKPQPSGRFQCKLCGVECCGIRKLMNHLVCRAHRKEQLECAAIRCPDHEEVTKNCIFGYGPKFCVKMKKIAPQFYKEKIVEELKKIEELNEEDDHLVELPKIPEKILQKGEALRHQRDTFVSTIKEESKESLENKKGTTAEKDIKNDKAKPIENEKIVVYNDGLVGVEYIIRILKSFDNSLNEYLCSLCNKTKAEGQIGEHILSFGHRLKYFETHYPDTIAKYKNKVGRMEYRKFMRPFGIILARLASAVESHFGYGCVRDAPVSMFKQSRSAIIKEIIDGPHASHLKGPNFMNTISNKQIREYVANDIYTLKYENTERFSARSEKNYKDLAVAVRKDRETNTKSTDKRERRGGGGRSKSRSPRRRNRSRSRSPRRSGKRYRSISPRGRLDSDIWSMYRHEVSKLANEIDLKYAKYRQCPETYPYYDNEWKLFWKNRRDELTRQGIDHRGYDFQSEWTHYFKQRLEIFFGEDLQQAQIEVRRRLNIPLNAEEDTPNIGHGKRSRIEEPVNWHEAKEEPLDVIPKWPTDNKPNVIHVLRLLTAFEDHLGSLGAKVMDLLSKALALEKSFANDPLKLEESILTLSNCTIIETAAEKLKGIVFAGLLDPKRMKSFTTVIQTAEDLLKHAEMMGYRISKIDESQMNELNNEADLQQIFNAIQKGGVNMGQDKALSDTLLDLISAQNDNRRNDSFSMGSSQTNFQNKQNNNRKVEMTNKNMYNNEQRVSHGDNGRGNSSNQYNSSYRNSNNYNNVYGSGFNQKAGGDSSSGYNQFQNSVNQTGSGLLSFDTNLRNPNNSDMRGSKMVGNMGGNVGNNMGGNMGNGNLGGMRSMGNPSNKYNNSNNFQGGYGPNNGGMNRGFNSRSNMNPSNRGNNPSMVGASGGGGGYGNQNINNYDINQTGGNNLGNKNSGDFWRQY